MYICSKSRDFLAVAVVSSLVLTSGSVCAEPTPTEPAGVEAIDEQQLRPLIESLYRRLYAQTPPERRAELLLEMLRGELVEVRSLALRLATADAVNGRVPSGEVLAAALGSLGSENIGVRREAAQLLQVSPTQSTASDVVAHLPSETDAVTVSRLLRVLQRVPQASSLGLIFDVLNRFDESEVRGAALSALTVIPVEVLARQRESVLGVIAGSRIEVLPIDCLGVLSSLDEHALLIMYLESDSEVHSIAAARLLIEQERFTPQVLRAARDRESLFELACTALERTPTLDAYALAVSLPAPDDAARRGGLDRIFVQAEPSTASAILALEADTARRVELLEARFARVQIRAADWERLGSLVSEEGSLEIRYIRELLLASRAQDAAGVIDEAPPVDSPAGLAELYLRVQLLSGQHDEAVQFLGVMPESERRAELISFYSDVVETLPEPSQRRAITALASIISSAETTPVDDVEPTPDQ